MYHKGISTDGELHPCIEEGCEHIVPYDDEPWCFSHSPDSGSSVPGYSYKVHGVNVPKQEGE